MPVIVISLAPRQYSAAKEWCASAGRPVLTRLEAYETQFDENWCVEHGQRNVLHSLQLPSGRVICSEYILLRLDRRLQVLIVISLRSDLNNPATYRSLRPSRLPDRPPSYRWC